MKRRGMAEKLAPANLAEFHVENLLPARHDAAMTPVFFRRCGLVVAMIALLGGAVLLWPGGAVMLADRLAPDGSAGEATAAHLKTREQRKQSYYSQLARAQSPQAVVDVHRGLIGKALVQRWFLPLAP